MTFFFRLMTLPSNEIDNSGDFERDIENYN